MRRTVAVVSILAVAGVLAAAAAVSAKSAAPQTTLTGKPTSGETADTATFAFSSSTAGATFECKLDKEAWAACSSPKTLSGLAAGAHAFQVRALKGGAADKSPATYSWSIAKVYAVAWKLATMTSLTIKKNDSVSWNWADSYKHDVEIRKGKPSSSGTIIADSGDLTAPNTFTRKFTSAGTFTAFCSFHPLMEQKITVR